LPANAFVLVPVSVMSIIAVLAVTVNSLPPAIFQIVTAALLVSDHVPKPIRMARVRPLFDWNEPIDKFLLLASNVPSWTANIALRDVTVM
jgi:hypothetical protein